MPVESTDPRGAAASPAAGARTVCTSQFMINRVESVQPDFETR